MIETFTFVLSRTAEGIEKSIKIYDYFSLFAYNNTEIETLLGTSRGVKLVFIYGKFYNNQLYANHHLQSLVCLHD